MKTTPEFNAALQAFVEHVQQRVTQNWESHQLAVPTIVADPLQVRIRLVRREASGYQSVYGFVDEQGLVYRPAGWKGPAPHARCSIYRPETWGAAGPYGLAYLR